MIGTAHQQEQELESLYPVWHEESQWSWFEKNSRRFSERVFLVDGENSCTYQEIRKLAEQVSRGLYTLGVRPGEMAAVDMANRRELVASVFALSRLGCTAVLVNSRISEAERGYVLRKSDVTVLITDRPYRGDLRPEKRFLQILIGEGEPLPEGRQIGWQQLLSEYDAKTEEKISAIEEECRNPERTSMILFTSGSTSCPKGVMLTDNMLLRSAFATANTRHMEIGRRIYLPIPLFHAMGYVEGMLAAAMVGGSIVISKEKYKPKEQLLRMQEYEVNDIVCISSVMIRMMTAAAGRSMEFPHMHAAYWAGACPEWVWEAARRFFSITDCGNGYGMTECGSTSHIMSGCDPEEKVPCCHGKVKSAGIAAYPEGGGQILSVKILAEDGISECAPGEAGEILLKGIAVTKGYYKEAEATARLIDREGWMHTGDMGMVDTEGYLTFLGRMDDQFKVNGENVSPKFVEDVLLKCGNVRYAEVVGIPHGRCGEAGAAFVELYEDKPGAVSEIQEYMKRKLARFQQPEWILPMKASKWPRTSTGKISKKELKMIAERKLKQELK